jgi:hypothetical protein
LFFFCTFLLDQKSTKKIKSAEIPPHYRVRIACRLCAPRASWLLNPENSGFSFPTKPEKSPDKLRAHLSNETERKSPDKKGKIYKMRYAKLLATNVVAALRGCGFH